MRLIDADALTKELKHITDAYGGEDGDAVFTYYDPLIRRNQLVNMEEFIKRFPTIDPSNNGGCWGCECKMVRKTNPCEDCQEFSCDWCACKKRVGDEV